ncbi:MAG TPA: hypothetical protein VGI54_05835 [Solirubrobacteraceae bacterium]|jgi:hypothetical protein
METRKRRVAIETARHRIVGTIHLPRDGYRSRVTDYLNGTDRDFIAVTEVEIAPLEGAGPTTRHAFVALARSQIVMALEVDPPPA